MFSLKSKVEVKHYYINRNNESKKNFSHFTQHLGKNVHFLILDRYSSNISLKKYLFKIT